MQEDTGYEQGKQYVVANFDDLLQRYGGKYVAVNAGGVVDSDEDFSELVDRVFDRCGAQPIFIRKVEPVPRVVRVRERLRVRRPAV